MSSYFWDETLEAHPRYLLKHGRITAQGHGLDKLYPGKREGTRVRFGMLRRGPEQRSQSPPPGERGGFLHESRLPSSFPYWRAVICSCGQGPRQRSERPGRAFSWRRNLCREKTRGVWERQEPLRRTFETRRASRRHRCVGLSGPGREPCAARGRDQPSIHSKMNSRRVAGKAPDRAGQVYTCPPVRAIRPEEG